MIPARNRASVIGRAVASAVTQTLSPLEIIVVDDGSDDNGATIAAARDHAAGVIPLKIIERGKRHGAPSARNIGVSMAEGDWIALLDSDDAWAPEKLAEQARLAGPGTSAVFTDTVFERPGGQTTTKFAGRPVDPGELLFTNNLGGCSAAFIDRAAFEAVGGFDESLPSCQDWDMWLKLRDHGALRISPLPLTRYFFDGAERISRDEAAILDGHRIVFDRIAARQDIGDVAAMRRFQRFHLAQTKVYSMGVARGVLAPALTNMIRPHPRTTRRSSLHLMVEALRVRLGR